MGFIKDATEAFVEIAANQFEKKCIKAEIHQRERDIKEAKYNEMKAKGVFNSEYERRRYLADKKGEAEYLMEIEPDPLKKKKMQMRIEQQVFDFSDL